MIHELFIFLSQDEGQSCVMRSTSPGRSAKSSDRVRVSTEEPCESLLVVKRNQYRTRRHRAFELGGCG